MFRDLLKTNKQIVIIFILAFFIAAITFLMVFLLRGSPGQNEQPPAAQEPAVQIQKTIIGQTTTQEVEQLPGLLSKQDFEDGATIYEFRSPLILRPNEIITKNNKAVFERILIPQDPDALGYIKIPEYVNKYGEPEETIQGSRFYDRLAVTYVYAARGLAFVANPFTEEIFEIHVFEPTTISEYIQLYGSDVNFFREPERHP